MHSFFNLPDDIFRDDLRKTNLTKNSALNLEIDFVWILSGRTTALGKNADNLPRSYDKNDDLLRIIAAIKLANEIHQRTNKWIPIFYNGRDIHNEDLQAALKLGKITYSNGPFIIRAIDPPSTIGQIQSFINFLKKEVSFKIRNLAIFSSQFHLARAARTIGLDSPQINFDDDIADLFAEMQIFFYGIDHEFKHEGIEYDVPGEHQAMTRYSSGNNPSISRIISNNTFLNDVDHRIMISYAMQNWMEHPTWRFNTFEKLRRIKMPISTSEESKEELQSSVVRALAR